MPTATGCSDRCRTPKTPSRRRWSRPGLALPGLEAHSSVRTWLTASPPTAAYARRYDTLRPRAGPKPAAGCSPVVLSPASSTALPSDLARSARSAAMRAPMRSTAMNCLHWSGHVKKAGAGLRRYPGQAESLRRRRRQPRGSTLIPGCCDQVTRRGHLPHEASPTLATGRAGFRRDWSLRARARARTTVSSASRRTRSTSGWSAPSPRRADGRSSGTDGRAPRRRSRRNRPP